MIFSYEHNFLFMKTRKTGGSSVQIALSTVCGYDDIITGELQHKDGTVEEAYGKGKNTDRFFTDHPHPNLARTKQWVDVNYSKSWDELFKFGFVRNPFDLIVSRYHWDVAGKAGLETSVNGFREWLHYYCSDVGAWFQDLQSPYLFTNETTVDVIGSYETLDSDFKSICQHLKLPDLELGNFKGKYRPKDIPFQEYYDERSKQIILNYFQKDFENLNYATNF